VRLVGYPRVSTRGQVKADVSLPDQDREIRAWARRNGHRIVGMFPGVIAIAIAGIRLSHNSGARPR
jgi:DNA invertase Pin-like site-specific DNA recombinase